MEISSYPLENKPTAVTNKPQRQPFQPFEPRNHHRSEKKTGLAQAKFRNE